MARLNKLVDQLSFKVDGKKEVIKRLKHELNEHLKEVEEDMKILDEVKSVLIKPRKGEISVEFMRLIWVPLFRAKLAVRDNGVENNFDVEWNGYSGLGKFGECAFCGKPINGISSHWLCEICLSPVCESHSVKCESCGKTVCPEHSWTCGVCGKTLCVEEEKYTCAKCGKEMCSDCVRHCVKCGLDVSYCPDDIVVCDYCGLPFCEEHYHEHLEKCSSCGKDVCGLALTECEICGAKVCPDCVRVCDACGAHVCLKDSWTCDVCGKTFCSNEPRFTCAICGKTICKDDAYVCPACGRVICKDHVVTCPNCGAKVCPDCLVTVKSFFRTKRGCKLCIKP